MVFSKDKATNFDAYIANNDTFRSFKYNAELLGNTDADEAKRNLRNTTITEPLKYISNFWRSLEMPLINCIVELKLKWMENCVLSANSADNADVDSNNIIFTIKDTELCVPVDTLSAKNNQKL